jgi:hypothetical protein
MFVFARSTLSISVHSKTLKNFLPLPALKSDGGSFAIVGSPPTWLPAEIADAISGRIFLLEQRETSVAV